MLNGSAYPDSYNDLISEYERGNMYHEERMMARAEAEAREAASARPATASSSFMRGNHSVSAGLGQKGSGYLAGKKRGDNKYGPNQGGEYPYPTTRPSTAARPHTVHGNGGLSGPSQPAAVNKAAAMKKAPGAAQQMQKPKQQQQQQQQVPQCGTPVGVRSGLKPRLDITSRMKRPPSTGGDGNYSAGGGNVDYYGSRPGSAAGSVRSSANRTLTPRH